MRENAIFYQKIAKKSTILPVFCALLDLIKMNKRKIVIFPQFFEIFHCPFPWFAIP